MITAWLCLLFVLQPQAKLLRYMTLAHRHDTLEIALAKLSQTKADGLLPYLEHQYKEMVQKRGEGEGE